MHFAASGAFTGEVSAAMLTEVGAHGVILGHSERRELFAENDRALAQKVPAALDAGLLPILCVGETEEERERGDTERKLRHQVQEDLAKVPIERLGEVVIAYEPIWAIGTGLVATPEEAQEAIAFIRALIADRSREQAELTRILYGGSVKPENAVQLRLLPDVDASRQTRWRRSWRRRSDGRRRLGVDPGAGVRTGRPRRLGDRRARPGQRGVAGGDTGVRLALGNVPAHQPGGFGAGRRTARRPDGQL
jgi:triosephosphate isomerase